jgi:hypothetical protein
MSRTASSTQSTQSALRFTVPEDQKPGSWFIADAVTGDVAPGKSRTQAAAQAKADQLNAKEADKVTHTEVDRENSVLAGVTTAKAATNGRAKANAAKPASINVGKRSAATKAGNKAVFAGKANPKAGPKADPKPAKVADTAKRDAKQALARKVLTAIAGLNLSDDDAVTAAFWVHHLPTGKSEPGSAEAKRHDRWWPTTLPIPDRSDWR